MPWNRDEKSVDLDTSYKAATWLRDRIPMLAAQVPYLFSVATYFAPDFLKCHTKLQSACLAASEIQETKRHVFIALFFLAAET